MKSNAATDTEKNITRSVRGQSNVRLWPKDLNEARLFATAHFARYMFAKSFVAGKNLCDIACGVGYGTYLLAQSAASAVGIDISDEAIDWARINFCADNTSFHCADGSEAWPVDETFDVITCFETLEHVPAPNAFIKQLVMHLAPGGKLFLSVPNGPRDEKRANNPHHLHHFNEITLKELVGKYFAEAQFYSQAYKKNWKHYAAKCLRKCRLTKKQRYFPENYFLLEGLDSQLKTWFVTAEKRNEQP